MVEKSIKDFASVISRTGGCQNDVEEDGSVEIQFTLLKDAKMQGRRIADTLNRRY
jgi:hypothetical protein